MSLFATTERSRLALRRTAGRGVAAMRAWRTAAAVLALGAAALIPTAAQAQAQAQPSAGGQIFIPGPGEHAAAGADRMITIPGAGERAGLAATQSGVIVIPGPGERAAPVAAAFAKPAGPASAQVMPVVVTSAPRAPKVAQPIPVDRPASAGGPATVPTTLQSTKPAVVSAAAVAASPAPIEAAAPAGQQDGESIRRAARAFLQQQSAGLPGKITITVAPAFPRGLAACTTLEPFMPPGARLWGRTTVGVRCSGARPWTLYLQARVSLESAYYLAARQIEPGAVLSAADLTTREGDLANLPRTIITDPSQAVGAVALARIGAGLPLRQDMLRSATSVTIGQTVRVVAVGHGFSISAEGAVMNNAAPGEQVRVKTAAGQIISGIVKDNTTVEIQM